jgi:hypothetical protein
VRDQDLLQRGWGSRLHILIAWQAAGRRSGAGQGSWAGLAGAGRARDRTSNGRGRTLALAPRTGAGQDLPTMLVQAGATAFVTGLTLMLREGIGTGR